MKIRRVAQTFLEDLDGVDGYVPHSDLGEVTAFEEGWWDWVRSLPRDSDELAEMAGRLCYKSWDRPNPATAKNSDYIANIIKQRHFSVLEHASVTYYVSEVSRALLTELERHRHLSYSVVSQRYVDHSNAGVVVHPAIRELPSKEHHELVARIVEHQRASQALYSHIDSVLKEHGVSKKRRRGAARMVLPEGTATELVVTGNLRAWREVIEKRWSEHAEDEIRELATLILADLKEYAPATFQDFEEEKNEEQ